tara:strand:+ start:94 stop:282 length:189 start_codon:yes stop_codon:yes gene_type:complete
MSVIRKAKDTGSSIKLDLVLVCPGRSGQIFDQHRKQISFSFGRLTESEKLEMQPENKIADQA